MATLDDFKELDIRIATIRDVFDHPNADKLYVLKVDVGDKQKQLVAGIKLSYSKEELIGKQIVVIDNLEPAMIRQEESQGMLLAAQDESGIDILSPERHVQEGSVVR